MDLITRFYKGHDCIDFECINDSKRCYPGSGWPHGRHGLDIVFYVNGLKGAVYFTIFTGWMPKFAQKDEYIDWGESKPNPAQLGYISKKPMYKNQNIVKERIDFLDIYEYYHDSSGLNSRDAFYSLINGGDDALWNFLEQYYRCIYLEGFDSPKAVEYPKKTRR